MASPLAGDQLYLPRRRRSLVRPPAAERAPEPRVGGQADVVSAPAGFGKTTLLAAWLGRRGRRRPVRGVAFARPGDHEPAMFWTYVITALQTAVPEVGAGALPLLQSAQPPIETVLAALLNELSAHRTTSSWCSTTTTSSTGATSTTG